MKYFRNDSHGGSAVLEEHLPEPSLGPQCWGLSVGASVLGAQCWGLSVGNSVWGTLGQL